MKNIIKLFKPIVAFFLWQYKQIDALRPDDTPAQVFSLYLLLILFELAIFGLTVWLYGVDIASILGMIGNETVD